MKFKPWQGGIPAFLLTWIGQVTSLVGSGLTSFALGVWVFERTGSPTLFALISLFAVLPRLIFSPVAGALVDRWDRRKVMILADAGAGASTLLVALLLFSHQLELWHIYLAAAASSFFGTFQWPAYSAAVTQLIPKSQLGRANGLIQFGRAAAEILAPALAGALVQSIQLQGVILIDVATFLFALLTLSLVRFPALKVTHVSDDFAAFKADLSFGWRYILARRGLLDLLFFLSAVNFIWGMVGALVVPMILSFGTAAQLGAIITAAGIGMFAGSLLMTTWGGPKRRIHGVLFFELISGFCFLWMGLRPDFWLIAAGAFGAHLTIALVFGSNQALWQAKVAAQNQGRVFAAQQMLISLAAPFAYLAAGVLAENIFEPWMASGRALTLKLSMLLGSGPGRGIGLMFVIMGLVKIIISILGYLNPHLRRVEVELRDAP